MINWGEQITLQRQLAEMYLLPDIAQVFPKSGTNARVVGIGIQVSDDPEPREWRGQLTLPCRIDVSRAFRPAKIEAQVTEVDEFILTYPWDAVLEPSDRVRINNVNYVVRKRDNLSNFNVLNEAIIVVLGAKGD